MPSSLGPPTTRPRTVPTDDPPRGRRLTPPPMYILCHKCASPRNATCDFPSAARSAPREAKALQMTHNRPGRGKRLASRLAPEGAGERIAAWRHNVHGSPTKTARRGRVDGRVSRDTIATDKFVPTFGTMHTVDSTTLAIRSGLPTMWRRSGESPSGREARIAGQRARPAD